MSFGEMIRLLVDVIAEWIDARLGGRLTQCWRDERDEGRDIREIE
jgi:hypothetical protein